MTLKPINKKLFIVMLIIACFGFYKGWKRATSATDDVSLRYIIFGLK